MVSPTDSLIKYVCHVPTPGLDLTVKHRVLVATSCTMKANLEGHSNCEALKVVRLGRPLRSLQVLCKEEQCLY